MTDQQKTRTTHLDRRSIHRFVERHPLVGSAALWYLWLVGGSAWASQWRHDGNIIMWAIMFVVGFALSYIATVVVVNHQHIRWTEADNAE